MTKLDRYLAGRLLSSFLKTSLALVLLFIVIDVVTHQRSRIIEYDVPAPIVIEYYLYMIPVILNNYQLAPLSLLVAGLLVFGNFVQRSEYTAALAGGIGLKRLLLMPVLMALAGRAVLFAVNNTIGAYAVEGTIEIDDTHFGKAQRGDHDDEKGIFWPGLEHDWKCDVRTFDRKTLTGENIFLYAIQEGRHEQIQADRLVWDAEQEAWFLEEGTWSIFDEARDNVAQTRSFRVARAPFEASPDYLLTAEVNTDTRSIMELANLHDKHAAQGYTARRLYLDMQTKIVNPLLCVLFMVLSVPFSVRLGRGNLSVGLSVAIMLGVGYIILAGVSQGMGYSGQISPGVAAWLPFGAYFIGCMALISRTPT
jgi:lipopolysaccharide export system permease protein